MKSVFGQGVRATTVVPKSLEIMAKDAGLTGVSVDQKRYRWIDPNEAVMPAVSKIEVMKRIGLEPLDMEWILNSKAGYLLPPAPSNPDLRYVKISNSGDEVLIQRARSDGRPDQDYKPIILFMENGEIKTRKQ